MEPITPNQMYERLQDQDRDLLLVIVRETALHDLAAEVALREWGDCPCDFHWDALLIRCASVLPEFSTRVSTRAKTERKPGTRVVEGQGVRAVLWER